MQVIDLSVERVIRNKKKSERAFQVQAEKLPKAELLQAMLMQDEIVKLDPMNIQATIRAQILLEQLEKKAELNHLRMVATEYRRKLAIRLYSQVKAII